MLEKFKRLRPIFFTALLFPFIPAVTAFGQISNSNQFTDDSQRIVEVSLQEGLHLADAMVIYPHGNSWFIPLYEFSTYLEFQMNISVTLGLAEGSTLSPDNKFRIDTKNCSVEYERKKEKYDCTQVQIFGSEIYVDINLLQQWFPLDISFNTYSSFLIIRPRSRLPMQERAEREQRASTLQNSAVNRFDPGFPRFDTLPSIFDGPFIDQQLTLNRFNTSNSNANSFRHDTTGSAEILGFESTGYLSGSLDKVEQTRLTLAKRSPDGELLGPLHAQSIEAYDVQLPALSLVGGGRLGRGVSISSYPIIAPDNFSNQTIQGDLPSGWEVELYQNEILIDRKVTDQGTRFSFSQVPILYGMNRYKLIFYGPQGQRREEYRYFNIDHSLLRPKQRSFKIAGAQVNNIDDRLIFQVDQNLLHSLTGRVGYAHLTPAKTQEYRNYTNAGLFASVGSIFLQTNASFMDTNGKAGDYGLQIPFGNQSAGLRQTLFDNYYSDLYIRDPGKTLHRSTTAQLSLIPLDALPLRLTAEVSRNEFVQSDAQDILTQRTSFLTGRFFWNNELSYLRGTSESTTGEISNNYLGSTWQMRVNSSYTDKEVQTLGWDFQKKISDQHSYRLNTNYVIHQQITNYTASINTRFDLFTFSANIGSNTLGEFSMGAVVSYSIMRDMHTEKWSLNANPQAAFGAASVLTFQDNNRNGEFDESDTALPDVKIQTAQRELRTKTDNNGLALIGQLQPYQPVDLSVDLSSIEDPYQRPLEKGIRFFPRPGRTSPVDIAIQSFTEASGTLITDKYAKKGFLLELFDKNGKVIASAYAENDGFYNFDYLTPGEYLIRPSSKSLEEKHLTANPRELKIVVTEEGSSITDLDFNLEKTLETSAVHSTSESDFSNNKQSQE